MQKYLKQLVRLEFRVGGPGAFCDGIEGHSVLGVVE